MILDTVKKKLERKRFDFSNSLSRLELGIVPDRLGHMFQVPFLRFGRNRGENAAGIRFFRVFVVWHYVSVHI